ncbi:MAG: sigma-70 family RNA polymerase sigma factor [Gemmatimonadales bacterium]
MSKQSFDFNIAVLHDIGVAEDERDAEWRRVFEHFDPRLRDFFGQRTDSASELDELMSELWRRVLLGVHRLDSHRAAWNWMVTIGTNVLRGWGRSAMRERKRAEGLVQLACTDMAPDFIERVFDDAPGDDRMAVVLARIAALPEKDRLLVALVAEDRTHTEIARRLSLASAAASRQRLRRIRLVITTDLDLN